MCDVTEKRQSGVNYFVYFFRDKVHQKKEFGEELFHYGGSELMPRMVFIVFGHNGTKMHVLCDTRYTSTHGHTHV